MSIPFEKEQPTVSAPSKKQPRASYPRLSKDQRAAFVAEFEKEGKIISDPNYYAITDKNGKLQIRRRREKSPPKTEVQVDENSHPPIDSRSAEGLVEELKEPKEKTL